MINEAASTTSSNIKPNVVAPEEDSAVSSANAKPTTTNGDAVEEDEFAQLAKNEDGASSSSSSSKFSSSTVPESIFSNELVAVDELLEDSPPVTVKTSSKEEDMVNFLSIVLSTPTSEEDPQAPNPAPAQSNPVAVNNNNNAQPNFSSSYVVPWAQSQPQPQPQPQPPQQQYPPPPWAQTPGYISGQNTMTPQQTSPNGPQPYQNQQSSSFQSPQTSPNPAAANNQFFGCCYELPSRPTQVQLPTILQTV